MINYKEALNQITIDLAAAGSLDEQAGTKGTLKWTLQSMAPRAPPALPKVGDDSASQVAGMVAEFSGDAGRKQGSSKVPGLSKNKLADFQREYQESVVKSTTGEKKEDGGARSKVGSQMPSIAPSKAKSKMS